MKTTIIIGLLGLASSVANAEERTFVVSGELGAHLFSNTSELGVRDLPGRVPHPTDSVVMVGTVGYRLVDHLTLEGQLALIPTKNSRDSTKFALGIGTRVSLAVDIGTIGPVTPFAIGGLGLSSIRSNGSALDEIGNDTDLTFDWGLGAFYRLSDKLSLRVDARHIIGPSTGDQKLTSDFEFVGGVSFSLGEDHSSNLPSPVVVEDRDGDGILDDVDSCPDDPEDPDGFEDLNGCPDYDNDGDKILDKDDNCPLKAESFNGIDDTDGCPEEDLDGDGLVGSSDQCPHEPEDMDGFEDQNGCPDPDNDKDSVLDVDDKCPTTMETLNGYQDSDGCPDELPQAVKSFSGAINGIQFERGSSEIRESSFALLIKVSKQLEEFPDLRLQVVGHTSTSGTEALNFKLSQARADAVVRFLVSKGVKALRVTAIGRGSAQPIADNSSRRGRAKNRRIEFKIVAGGSAK